MNLENPFENIGKTKENSKEKELDGLLEKLAGELKSENFPVDNSCRIDMASFNGAYGKEAVKEDVKKVKEREKQWHPNLSEEDIVEKKAENDGEKLEKLVVALFSKFLKDKFIVARASAYDDVFNGVDTIILNKENGNLVCAFDEVADVSGPGLQNKSMEIAKKNEHGSKLKYGVKIDGEKLIKGVVVGAPIFYLALPSRQINEGIKNMENSLDEISDYERNLFKYFIDLLQYQYSFFKLEKSKEPATKHRAAVFKETLAMFKEQFDSKGRKDKI